MSESLDDLLAHQDWLAVFGAAMHDAVPNRDEVHLLRLAQPGSCNMDGRGKIGNLVWRKHPVDRSRTVNHSCAQTRPYPNSVDLALEQSFELARRLYPEQLEFEARGTGIDDENGFHGVLHANPNFLLSRL